MSGTQTYLPQAFDGAMTAVPEAELAEALLLVRVSTMKMLRLQLAIERRDRAVALQAVDDLVELDEWMAGCAGRISNVAMLEAFEREVDDERQALLREKFSLAAGLVKGGPPAWTDRGPEEVLELAEIVAPPINAASDPAPEVEAPAHWRAWMLIVAALALLVAVGVGAAMVLDWYPNLGG